MADAEQKIRTCPECGAQHKRRRFCSSEHQRDFNRRQLSEGVRVIAFAKAWALGKGGGNTKPNETSMAAMREMTQILRSLNGADKAAGRMNAIDYAALLMADGSRWFDRQKG